MNYILLAPALAYSTGLTCPNFWSSWHPYQQPLPALLINELTGNFGKQVLTSSDKPQWKKISPENVCAKIWTRSNDVTSLHCCFSSKRNLINTWKEYLKPQIMTMWFWFSVTGVGQKSHLTHLSTSHVALRPHGRNHVTGTHCVAFNEANRISMDTDTPVKCFLQTT